MLFQQPNPLERLEIIGCSGLAVYQLADDFEEPKFIAIKEVIDQNENEHIEDVIFNQ